MVGAARRRGREQRGHMRLDLTQRREVEDQRVRQRELAPEPLRQTALELGRTERVEPSFHQRRVCRHL